MPATQAPIHSGAAALLARHYVDDKRLVALVSSLQVDGDTVIGGVNGGLFPLLISSLRRQLQGQAGDQPQLVVAPDPEALVDDLEALGLQAVVLPELEDHDPEEGDDLDLDLLGRRQRACESFLAGALMVATSRAVQQPVSDLAALGAGSISIRVGDTVDINELAERLCEQHYRVTPLVEEPGTISQRGGVLDLWPWTDELPLRLEFFDTEVESIRRFEADSQETVARLQEVRLSGSLSGAATRSLWKFLSPAPIIVLGDVPLRGRLRADHGRRELRLATITSASDVADGASTAVERFKGDLHRDLRELEAVRDEGLQVLVLARNHEAATAHQEMLQQHGIPGAVALGRLSGGWRDQHLGLLVIHDFELAHRLPQRRSPRTRVGGGSPLASLSDLRPGDYVVHLNHGIGRFRGMTTLERRGFMEDFLLLEFAGESKLYLPVSAIDLVQKYIGGAGRHPPLDQLGGKVWAKRKAKAEKAIADLSGELIEAQAQREAASGLRHPADDAEQRRFEASFPFEETEDQLTALREIKADLEAPTPMDRLLCGDVGFGKTELALRAAFACVRGGRQVALLAPTTILADQHERTFAGRLRDFPLRIACMNRFRSAAERRAILEETRRGEIDILIGTHAILSKELRFADLGLLIIDEEQRFGVRHKEHLRSLRHGVDVLTLSATPIPRTLHFSMLGLRDISVLAEAPAQRLAVATRVCHWDKALLKQACERELERGGQIFVINHRIEDLDSIAFKLARLVPEMRYEVLHGRMNEATIHGIMDRFRRGELHCLIATTIVESGLDIPNANTLIVNNAHAYGLGELHQLRGRIGRFTRQAYAYFVVPAAKALNEDARSRLEAIQEYAGLGAGFKLAMRDLELRGAGNLLGAQQSGHIEAIGYELYCRLLAEAVNRLRGGAADGGAHPLLGSGGSHSQRLAFPIDAYIPDDWLEAPQLKFELHKLLEASRRQSDLEQTARVFRDRFGRLPDPVVRLFTIHALDRRLQELGIQRVELKDRHLRLRLHAGLPDILAQAQHPDLVHVQAEEGAVICFLKTAPDQDRALNLLAHICALDLGYLGRGS